MSQFVDIFPLPLFATVPLSGFAATGSPEAATKYKRPENPAMNRIPSAARVRRLVSLFGLGLALAALGSTAVARDTYYVNDHLATTVAAIDTAGEISALETDAFGTAVARSDRFTGKPYDDDMGAHVFPFRNYRSEEARWMSGDPSGFPDGINQSRYLDNPLNEIDNLGLYAYDLGAELPTSALVGLDDALRQLIDTPGASLAAGWNGLGLTFDFLSRYMHHSGDQTLPVSTFSGQSALRDLNNSAKSSVWGTQFSGGAIQSSQWSSSDLRMSFGGVYVSYSYSWTSTGWDITGSISDPYDFSQPLTTDIPYLRSWGGWNGDSDTVSDIWMRQLADGGFASVFTTSVSWTMHVE